MGRLKKNLKEPEFVRSQFGQGADDSNERIKLAGGEREHEFPRASPNSTTSVPTPSAGFHAVTRLSLVS